MSLPPEKRVTLYVLDTVIQALDLIPRISNQEPHPADDLNGYDVARKLTILSRLISYASPTALPSLESFLSVQTASLIPPLLENIPTGDEFLKRLPEYDTEFAKLREDASNEGNVLRFVGIVDVKKGVVKAGLEK